jgi:chlorite dismutase
VSEAGPAQRQFVKFNFYRVGAEWRRLSPEERAKARDEFCRAVDAFGDRMLIRSYSLFGLRADADFMLWLVSDRLEDFQELATAAFSSAMGPYLSVPYAYLSLTRRSIYKAPTESKEVDGRLRVYPGEFKYLFVYPFVKTRPWYELSKDVRQEMMNEHIVVGRRYPSVKLNTTYSYGLDDQEFVVSFETDSPADFLDLVMELRETKASMYTLRDTPTFTCVSGVLPDILGALGAPGDVELPAPARGALDGEWEPVARVADIADGGATVVHVGGEPVALFRISERVYAIANRCSHANGPLAEGSVEGTTVTCPWHDSQFDLETGQPLRSPAQRPVTSYRVRVEDGTVLLARAAVTAPSQG